MIELPAGKTLVRMQLTCAENIERRLGKPSVYGEHGTLLSWLKDDAVFPLLRKLPV